MNSTEPVTQPPAVTATPEELLERFAGCVAAADLEGIVQLYAADAVVSLPHGREAAGHDAIRAAFAAALAAGVDLDVAQVCTPLISGAFACTSATTRAGAVRTQVARRDPDLGWRWIRDGFRLREVTACLPPDPMAAVA